MAFAPRGPWLVTNAGTDARVWNTESATLVAESSEHRGNVTAVAFSPDGRRVASISFGGTILVWDPANGRTLLELRSQRILKFVTFSQDGRLLLTGQDDGAAMVWSVADGRLIATLRGVELARFSPDARFIAVTGRDGTARIWDAETADSLMVLAGSTGAEDVSTQATSTGSLASKSPLKPSIAMIRSAEFSPDGRSILTAGADGAAQIYQCEPCASPDELLALALRRVTRRLTPEERRRYLHETRDEPPPNARH